MTLEQIAQQAMNYLDDVGVAADYDIKSTAYGIERLTVITDDYRIGMPSFAPHSSIDCFLGKIKEVYPQKSPA